MAIPQKALNQATEFRQFLRVEHHQLRALGKIAGEVKAQRFSTSFWVTKNQRKNIGKPLKTIGEDEFNQ
jgi:hypothetical protein